MRTRDFAEIEPELMARVGRMVWCNAASVDAQGRPRSRILHPLWEGPIAWITTDDTSFKRRHLLRVPYLSLAYVSDVAKPAYADCHAEWISDRDTKQHVWDYCSILPEPMGFDPAPIYGSVDGSAGSRLPFGVIKLTPYRVTLTQWPEAQIMWTAEDDR